MKKLVKVIGAIIENESNEILCALRSNKMTMPDLWEFPGGKVEEGESLKETIEREIQEELHCRVAFEGIFHETLHEYQDIIVNLITARCCLISGVPTATEHASVVWLKREDLPSLSWAPADLPTVKLLCQNCNIISKQKEPK